MDQRKNLRFKTRFDALISSGPKEGSAVLSDLSYSGARLESASLRPEVGTEVRLYVFVQPVAPFELIGHVVRLTDDGFAMSVDVFGEEVKRLVDDVAAIVCVPR